MKHMGRKMKGIYFLLIFYVLISSTFANNCGNCGMHGTNLTNSGFANAGSGTGQPVCLADSYPGQNISCGCDLNNSVVVNSTDLFGRVLGPMMAYQKVNLTYWADLDIRKIPHLVTNMSQVGPDWRS